MKWPDRLTKRDALRAGSAAKHAVAASAAAQTLFQVGGGRVLPAPLRQALLASAEKAASRVLAVRRLGSS
ncbi:MAG: hypothetical protein M3O50_14600, partial [Myxococcota bacterium]|nr:hypothetical protein [Myxococcota bacterium]